MKSSLLVFVVSFIVPANWKTLDNVFLPRWRPSPRWTALLLSISCHISQINSFCNISYLSRNRILYCGKNLLNLISDLSVCFIHFIKKKEKPFLHFFSFWKAKMRINFFYYSIKPQVRVLKQPEISYYYILISESSTLYLEFSFKWSLNFLHFLCRSFFSKSEFVSIPVEEEKCGGILRMKISKCRKTYISRTAIKRSCPRQKI